MPALIASIAYLALAHAGTLTGRIELHAAAIALLLILILVSLRGVLSAQLGLGAIVAACLYFAEQPMQLMLYAPPVLFPLLLAALFGRSLLPGRQPLIERVVWHMHGQPEHLDQAHRSYARGVTLYWCLVCTAMALLNLILAIFASPAVWSWVGNIATYLMPGVALIAEYAWRKRVFPVQQYRNLFDFLLRVIRLGPTLVREVGHDWRREDDDATPAVRP